MDVIQWQIRHLHGTKSGSIDQLMRQNICYTWSVISIINITIYKFWSVFPSLRLLHVLQFLFKTVSVPFSTVLFALIFVCEVSLPAEFIPKCASSVFLPFFPGRTARFHLGHVPPSYGLIPRGSTYFAEAKINMTNIKDF